MSDSHPIAQLAAYRELTPAERQAVQAHLAVCSQCRAQFTAFQRQDALFAGLPDRVPTRQAQPQLPAGRAKKKAGNGLATLGNWMAASGVVGLTAALALLVRVAATAPIQTGSAPVLPGLPLMLPPDLPARVSPWLLAAPWLAGAVAVLGLLLALGRYSRIWTILGMGLGASLLISYIPPLTALPNPVGLVGRALTGYSYDPNLPFKNLFLVSGEPTAILEPYLDRLIGQTGLDPLDPVQPLAGYHFVRVTQPRDERMILVSTRFTYADGSSRTYDIPLVDPAPSPSGLYLGGWQNDGLARLRTEHLSLPGQPFATESSPVRLGQPQRQKLSPQADKLDSVNPAHWLWVSNRLQHLVLSPQGDAVLMVEHDSDHSWELWLVSLNGAAPQSIYRGSNVFGYAWSPDGQFIAYVTPGDAFPGSSQLALVRRDAPQTPIARRSITNGGLPSLTAQGVWYGMDETLWLMDYQTGQSARVVSLPELGHRFDYAPLFWPVAVSPDASRVAYLCNSDLCVMNLDGGNRRTIRASRIRNITWDRTGARLAATSLDLNNLGPVSLMIVSRDGELEQSVNISPRDATDPPQWTPDGQMLFVQTYPMGGRRILSANVKTGEVLDLSQAHWDTYFALTPDGKSLLLNNGRGGFWLAPLIR